MRVERSERLHRNRYVPPASEKAGVTMIPYLMGGSAFLESGISIESAEPADVTFGKSWRKQQ